MRCSGRHCRFRVHRSDRAALHSLWRRLERVRFSSGERLLITISHPRRTSIRVLVRFRDRRAPIERRLRRAPLHHRR
ncbi:MAG: hypothetical protein ACRDK8_05980 [Solirubrobacteraceae bacterium]